MKKLLLVVLILIIIIISSIYILIPKKIVVSTITYTDVKNKTTLRYLQNITKWQQWISKPLDDDSTFNYKNYNFKVLQIGNVSTKILINNNIQSEIIIIPYTLDSSAIEWQFSIATGYNPFNRLVQYQLAKNLKNTLAPLLTNFQSKVQNTVNVYGFNIHRTTITDTTLISVKKVFKHYPSTEEIYLVINELKNYIEQQRGVQRNYPMLNITFLKDSNFKVMVGIPTDKPLPENSKFKEKRMIKLVNKTLCTDVSGDDITVQQALRATNDYMNDNELSSPVIPFQQLITDRIKQHDSTKWITKIFTPII